jgi:outer membrane biosynthesis protein TonB
LDERRSYSAWAVSSALHGALLALLLLGFASAPKFEDSPESIPVETVSVSDLNQIMNGEKDAKPAPHPPPAPQPAPPTPPEAPPDLRASQEPTPPPKPEPTPQPKPEPAPPPTPPPKPAPPQPPKASAEDAPEPPPRPKVVETPPEHAKEPPERPKQEPIPKTTERDKSEPQAKPVRPYDPNAIAKLIGQSKPSTPSSPTNAAGATPQGLPHHDAPRMSVSMASALDAWLTESYLNCWTPPPAMPEGDVYVAQVKVVFNADGSLSARPVLINPPTDPAWRAHAESAMRAVKKCDPLHVPPQYAPYFDQWKVETIHFDPRETQG